MVTAVTDSPGLASLTDNEKLVPAAAFSSTVAGTEVVMVAPSTLTVT